MLRKLSEDIHAVVDLGVVITVGIAFAGLMVIAYILWTVRDQLVPAYPGDGAGAATNASASAGNASALTWNTTYGNAASSVGNVTTGFDAAVNLILIAVTVFILSIAIAALLMLRGRQ